MREDCRSFWCWKFSAKAHGGKKCEGLKRLALKKLEEPDEFREWRKGEFQSYIDNKKEGKRSNPYSTVSLTDCNIFGEGASATYGIPFGGFSVGGACNSPIRTRGRDSQLGVTWQKEQNIGCCCCLPGAGGQWGLLWPVVDYDFGGGRQAPPRYRRVQATYCPILLIKTLLSAAQHEVRVDQSRGIMASREFGIFIPTHEMESCLNLVPNNEKDKLQKLQDFLGSKAPDWQGIVVKRKDLPKDFVWPADYYCLTENVKSDVVGSTKVGSTEGDAYNKQHLDEISDLLVGKQMDNPLSSAISKNEDGALVVPNLPQATDPEGEKSRKKLKKTDSDESYDYTGGIFKPSLAKSRLAAPKRNADPGISTRKVMNANAEGWESNLKRQRRLQAVQSFELEATHVIQTFSMDHTDKSLSMPALAKLTAKREKLIDESFFILFRSRSGEVTEEGMKAKDSVTMKCAKVDAIFCVLESATMKKPDSANSKLAWSSVSFAARIQVAIDLHITPTCG